VETGLAHKPWPRQSASADSNLAPGFSGWAQMSRSHLSRFQSDFSSQLQSLFPLWLVCITPGNRSKVSCSDTRIPKSAHAAARIHHFFDQQHRLGILVPLSR